MTPFMLPDSEPEFVLDASAVLAYVQDEPGGDVVDPLLAHSVISSVNLAEVLQKALAHGGNVYQVRRDLERLRLQAAPFDADDSEIAARLWLQAPSLSLAERACLALAQRLGLPAVTADRAWRNLSVDVEVRLIR